MTSFRPTTERLAPELTQREQICLLARALWNEGHDDHLAGHITVNQGDGTLLCNPWLLTWEEFGPDDVIRIDLDGNVVDGDWPVPLGIPIHLELHKARPGIGWALHHHTRWGSVWSAMKRVPPLHDQTGAGGGGSLVLVDE
jgi:ribulose-5-phosphate 4-epimerase/fuculose-1-phosphate aldolase